MWCCAQGEKGTGFPAGARLRRPKRTLAFYPQPRPLSEEDLAKLSGRTVTQYRKWLDQTLRSTLTRVDEHMHALELGYPNIDAVARQLGYRDADDFNARDKDRYTLKQMADKLGTTHLQVLALALGHETVAAYNSRPAGAPPAKLVRLKPTFPLTVDAAWFPNEDAKKD